MLRPLQQSMEVQQQAKEQLSQHQLIVTLER